MDSYARPLIGAAVNPSPPHFNFYLIADNRINAFALPGGYIGFNAGTIVALSGGYTAVAIQGTGDVNNTGTVSLIEGRGGVTIGAGGGVTNLGTIAATGSGSLYSGVSMHGAGTVSNLGSA